MDQSKEHAVSAPETASIESKPMNKAVTLAICLGGWLVPGFGHILLGRWIRGFVFLVCVLLMFSLGLAMHGKLYDLQFDEPLQFFAFVANLGAGVLYWVAARMGYGLGTMTWPSYDYGTTYLWVSGLLNYLIVLDVFDIAQGRKP